MAGLAPSEGGHDNKGIPNPKGVRRKAQNPVIFGKRIVAALIH